MVGHKNGISFTGFQQVSNVFISEICQALLKLIGEALISKLN